MEFLTQFLPIIIYILLIGLIIVCIILGIKLIITIDKILKVVDDVNEKIQKITPLFNTVSMISDKFSNAVISVFSILESMISKLFVKNNKRKEEIEDE